MAHSIFLIFQLDGEAREEDTTFVIHRGVTRRGRPTLSERKGGLFFSDAEKFETTLRTWGSAFHHLQLLREKGALGERSGAESFRKSAGRGAGTIRVFVAGLCLDAGIRALVDERAEKRKWSNACTKLRVS